MVGALGIVAILGGLVSVIGLGIILATKLKQVGAALLIFGAIFIAVPFLLPSAGLTGTGGTGTGVDALTGTPQTGTTVITASATGTFANVDKLEEGTTVNAVERISVSGNAFSTGQTAFSQGEKLDILYENITRYHSAFYGKLADGTVVNNGAVTVPQTNAFTHTGKLYQNASATLSIWNSNGDLASNALGGGTPNLATNQTVTVGSTYNLRIAIDGADKASTNDMSCILEATNGTAMKEMKLSGLGGATKINEAKPNWYTLQGTLSEIWTYAVPAVVGAQRIEGTLVVQSDTGRTLASIGTGSQGYVSCVAKEYFIDPDGKIYYGHTDSSGNAKYLANYRYGVQFSA